jgi:formylglycine-generating enzyme required for sulfatase activity
VYCERLTQLEQEAGRLPEGYVYRLPTEAEWEYAARAGSDQPFVFGDQANALNGNFRGVYPVGSKAPRTGSDHYGSLEVGLFSPNAIGLYDTHGNLAEWTLDRYNGRLHGDSIVAPRPREEGLRIAVRGGSWEDFAVRVRSAAREEVHEETTTDAIGFRVVLAPAF